ncbi:UDP-glucuronosyltransferase-like isoform X1 [Brienomyrus brachyistius]|uniref:UDP-glucuronosyltransferase-like isoform X1 n=1 Tax=Brienomyrus brachyistius TaxID=42636 RepID=UPI0020B25A9F|nr:UDP-glucuronosyltransferase-like isoform X1 [Brienomyrus brachyistius]
MHWVIACTYADTQTALHLCTHTCTRAHMPSCSLTHTYTHTHPQPGSTAPSSVLCLPDYGEAFVPLTDFTLLLPGLRAMTGLSWVALFALLGWLGTCAVGPVQGGKVLVMPVEGSHWLSMRTLVAELSRRGHETVVLVPETSILIGGTAYGRTEVFHVPYNKEELENTIKKFLDNTFGQRPQVMDLLVNVGQLLNFTGLQVRGCKGLLYDELLMHKLRSEGFDVVLTDPFLPCGAILASALDIPVVYFLRGLPCGLEYQAMQCPSPPSFVPRFFTGNTDVMTFPQRLRNMISTLIEIRLCHVIYASFDELATEYLGRVTTYRELIGHGAIWLLRYDFTFEFPRPVMPNMVFIGGINCAERNILPADLETFVNGSGEHGFVVFTLGSMVSQMPEDKAQCFFEAFRQIPQRVLWRYTGPVPADIPENVKLMKWLPQNDLLGHPKARAFVTHAGTHGIYEGICNAVPMVMLPLFGDQSDNVQRMVVRGVGETLNIYDITAEQIVTTLNKVINDSSYKDNIMKLSAVHKDRPIEPLDLAVFWTEFVMRHKGADHLRPAAHDLNWIQYHSLDVIGLLIIITVTVVIVTVKSCRFCCRMCFRGKTQKRKKE